VRRMRFLAVAIAVALNAAHAESAAPKPTLKELMVDVVEPASNAIFYVSRQPPQSDDDWKKLRGQALVLMEIANAMSGTRFSRHGAKDAAAWSKDLKAFAQASRQAYTAAKSKNQTALEELNDPLYTACSTCHEKFLPQR
jgi:hypothetical protein